jgi:hypothetical protein
MKQTKPALARMTRSSPLISVLGRQKREWPGAVHVMALPVRPSAIG